MRQQKSCPLYLLIALLLAPLAGVADAQALEVAPVTIDLPAGRLAGTLRITNHGSGATTIQIRPFLWSQPHGEEQLDPTPDLLVSPPFATLNPGDTQTVRLVLRKPAGAREGSYRLLLDELPPEVDPGSVHVVLRISLPVFAAPVGKAVSSLNWQVAAPGGHPALVVRNDGARRARLANLKLSAPGLVVATSGPGLRYVLAGAQATIPLDIKPAGSALPARGLHVSATSDQGKVDADAPVAPAS